MICIAIDSCVSHRCWWHWNWSSLRMASSTVDGSWYFLIFLPSLNWKRSDTHLKSLFLKCRACVCVWLLIFWFAVHVPIKLFWVCSGSGSGKIQYSSDDDSCSVVISIVLIVIFWANGLCCMRRLPKRSDDFGLDILILLLGIRDSQVFSVRFYFGGPLFQGLSKHFWSPQK